jgi:hypothetical protein
MISFLLGYMAGAVSVVMMSPKVFSLVSEQVAKAKDRLAK